MRQNTKVRSLLLRSLLHSLSIDLMTATIERIIPDYDVYERTGFPSSVPIPAADVAEQIVRDVLNTNLLMRYVELLISIDNQGFRGKRVPVRYLTALIRGIEDEGFRYDESSGVFMEDPPRRCTKGWSFLREGHLYELTLLRVDIAKNSRLVRRYDREDIEAAYGFVHRTFASTVERRNGRIWSWEGDGGMAAFFYPGKNVQACLAGMEMVLELFLYNTLGHTLSEPIQVRLAAHSGTCVFRENYHDVENDTLRRLRELESRHTLPDTVTLSPGVYSDLGTKLSRFFEPFDAGGGTLLYRHALRWEKQPGRPP